MLTRLLERFAQNRIRRNEGLRVARSALYLEGLEDALNGIRPVKDDPFYQDGYREGIDRKAAMRGVRL